MQLEFWRFSELISHKLLGESNGQVNPSFTRKNMCPSSLENPEGGMGVKVSGQEKRQGSQSLS